VTGGGTMTLTDNALQLTELGAFFATATAFIVCGCILTRKPRKKLPMNALQPVPEEHQPGCFALEEERGGN
jgi:hypothetical protein